MIKFTLGLTIIFLGFLFACNSRQEQKEEIVKSMNTPDRPISELMEFALYEGDTSAYETLDIAYLDYSPGEFLPIALKMANKYDYPKAYFDVYLALLDFNGIYSPEEPLDELDQKTKELALDYLISGAKKGHGQSIEILTDYYLNDNSNYQHILNTVKIKNEHGKYLDSLKNLIKD